MTFAFVSLATVSYRACAMKRGLAFPAGWRRGALAERGCVSLVPLSPTSRGRLVFSFGTNDCVIENADTRLTRAETLSHARGALAKAREHWPVLWIGPPPSELEDRSAAWVGSRA